MEAKYMLLGLKCPILEQNPHQMSIWNALNPAERCSNNFLVASPKNKRKKNAEKNENYSQKRSPTFTVDFLAGETYVNSTAYANYASYPIIKQLTAENVHLDSIRKE